jgi:hypothetical protein
VVFCSNTFKGARIRCGKTHRLEEIFPYENAKHFLFFKLSHVEVDKAKRPVDGLPAPGSAAERLRRTKCKQPAGEAQSPSIPTTNEGTRAMYE